MQSQFLGVRNFARGLALVCAVATPIWAIAAEPVKGKHYFHIRDSLDTKRYDTVQQACAAALRDGEWGSNKKPLTRAEGGKDALEGFGCYWKDDDGKEVGNSSAGIHQVECPENSTVEHIGSPPECDCSYPYVASGDKCVEKSAVAAAPSPANSGRPANGGSPPPQSGNDPCLDHPKTVDPEPKKTDACKLSWRSWDVRRYLHTQRGVSLQALEKSAVAVGEGYLGKAKNPVRIIGTNNADIAAKLRNPPMPLLEGEELAFPARGSEHAEQAVERTFEAKGVDKSRGVRMGSDPKACTGKCTPRYEGHAWVRHERPTLP